MSGQARVRVCEVIDRRAMEGDRSRNSLAADEADFLLAMVGELAAARKHNGPMNSMHEAYAVILEEVDEVWSEVKMKSRLRDKENVAKELLQVATMALRAYSDLVVTGRVNEV